MTPNVAAVAALLADPTRAAMLLALMDGRALTATELAIEGQVAPSTASSHLARLTDAGLLAMLRQGRQRYFRLAHATVAELLEGLLGFASREEHASVRSGPADPALRHARSCYDHLAGHCGVVLWDRLHAHGQLAERGGATVLTARGEAWCHEFGIDLTTVRASRRPLCRPCLDWSERRMHLAGALGAAILDRMLALSLLRRYAQGRALGVTPKGERFLDRLSLD
ncbi:ArsR/SmtB family transcription factor [Rhodanobacter ginsengisoli]|uniref:ArsR/SmtB family transcription factor n=1 Tax=Rhodanobacter ginsengisoli TaxID=418646 RepID=A0ABW0QM41_9GAMM